MSQKDETFATAVGCMDGRTEIPIEKYAKEKFGVQFVDAITEAGLVGILATDQINIILKSSLENKLAITVGNHHSKGIVVHGHQECAGNPVDDELHKKHVRKSVMVVKSLIRNAVPVVGVFVIRDQASATGWKVTEL